MNLQEGRDIVIIAAGGLAFLLFLALLVFTVVVGMATRVLLDTVQTLLKGEVTPILDSTRQTLQRVQGTAAFVSETTVSPIVRVYGAVATARRVLGVLSGVTGRRKRRA